MSVGFWTKFSYFRNRTQRFQFYLMEIQIRYFSLVQKWRSDNHPALPLHSIVGCNNNMKMLEEGRLLWIEIVIAATAYTNYAVFTSYLISSEVCIFCLWQVKMSAATIVGRTQYYRNCIWLYFCPAWVLSTDHFGSAKINFRRIFSMNAVASYYYYILRGCYLFHS